MTAKEWKEKNPNLKGNQRDYADIRQKSVTKLGIIEFLIASVCIL